MASVTVEWTYPELVAFAKSRGMWSARVPSLIMIRKIGATIVKKAKVKGTQVFTLCFAFDTDEEAVMWKLKHG